LSRTKGWPRTSGIYCSLTGDVISVAYGPRENMETGPLGADQFPFLNPVR
jgi:hypothetical protein